MHEVLGVGNAICDVLVKVEDKILEEFNLTKGAMSLCDEKTNAGILSSLKERGYQFKICSGGSVANTINYLSKYGLDTAFLGNAANGFYGQKFHQELEDSNIKFYNTYDNGSSTAKCVILVTEDGERTMSTSLGCAADLNIDNIDLDEISNSKYIYFEGYLWDNPKAVDAIITIAKHAQEKGTKIVFSLSDSFCVQRHHQSFQDFIYNYVNILFGNESEVSSLFDYQSLDNESSSLIQKKLSEIKTEQLIATQHDKGCTIITSESILQVPTIEKKAIDTTGAGDSFAAGYLYSLVNNLDLKSAANIANYIAGQVIGHLGARPEIILPKTPEDLEKKIA